MTRLLPKHIRSKISICPVSLCWNWTGEMTKNGYGRAWLLGKRKVAHKIVYRLFTGIKTYSREFDHTCTNRGCVNPDHLQIVTKAVNLKRRVFR